MSQPPFKRFTTKTFRHLRERQFGFTAEQMAKLCGASSGRVVRKWEAGDNEVPEGVCRFLWLLSCLPEAHRQRVINLFLDAE